VFCDEGALLVGMLCKRFHGGAVAVDCIVVHCIVFDCASLERWVHGTYAGHDSVDQRAGDTGHPDVTRRYRQRFRRSGEQPRWKHGE
jgi:hypothetical protein